MSYSKQVGTDRTVNAAVQGQGVLEATMPSPAAIRAELLETVSRDLLGPANGPDEEIHERSVRDRYVVGMLAPKHRVLEPETDEIGRASCRERVSIDV